MTFLPVVPEEIVNLKYFNRIWQLIEYFLLVVT